MSYPQPIASKEVLEGQEFFRLFTQLTSSGDSYEIDVSTKAFCIGPQSDIARARISYWDPENAANAQSFVVNKGEAFFGRVDAFEQARYSRPNLPGRIIVTPEDMYDRAALLNYVSGPALQQILVLHEPKIDLLSFLSPPNFTPLKRDAATYRGRMQLIPGRGFRILVPWYGRRFASITLTNYTGIANFTGEARGLNFTPDEEVGVSPPGVTDLQRFTMSPTFSWSAVVGSTQVVEIKSSQEGLFDYLEFVVNKTTPGTIPASNNNTIYYTVTVRDEET
jgi:hypothetical protein